MEPTKKHKRQLLCAGAVDRVTFWVAVWVPIVALLNFYGVREGLSGARLGAFGASWGPPAGCRARRGLLGLGGPFGSVWGLLGLTGGRWERLGPPGAIRGAPGLAWGLLGLAGPFGSVWGLLGLFGGSWARLGAPGASRAIWECLGPPLRDCRYFT